MKIKIFTYLKEHGLHIDRNILSYTICVLIAAILWLLNALNKDYTSDISYPVKYTGFPEGKYLISPLPKSITLEVKAKGFSLLGYYIRTSFLPITLDVNTYSNHLQKKDNRSEYTLRLNDIKDKINNRLSSEIKLLNIQPKEIVFKFSQAVSRKVPVRPAVSYSLKKQYILKGNIRVIPDSIRISGPASLVDTLSYILTDRWEAGEVAKDINRNLSLDIPSGLTTETKEVKISLFTERYTEARRTIPLQVVNAPQSLTVRLFPSAVEITYDVGLSMYDRITDKDFSFTVDLKNVKDTPFLTVKTEKKPPYIQNLTFTPQKVEYILEKNP